MAVLLLLRLSASVALRSAVVVLAATGLAGRGRGLGEEVRVGGGEGEGVHFSHSAVKRQQTVHLEGSERREGKDIMPEKGAEGWEFQTRTKCVTMRAHLALDVGGLRVDARRHLDPKRKHDSDLVQPYGCRLQSTPPAS